MSSLPSKERAWEIGTLSVSVPLIGRLVMMFCLYMFSTYMKVLIVRWVGGLGFDFECNLRLKVTQHFKTA